VFQDYATRVNNRAALFEKFPQFVIVEMAVFFPVKTKTNLAVGSEVLVEVIKKEPPFLLSPELVRLMTIKADHEGSYKIELTTQFRQPNEWSNLPDDPTKSEHKNHVAEESTLINIQADNVMTEILRDKEKVTGPAAKIEDSFAESTVQAKVAHSTQVHCHPFLKVKILKPAIARVAREMAFAQRFELVGIDGANQAIQVQAKSMSPIENHPLKMALRTFNCLAIPYLPYLLC